MMYVLGVHRVALNNIQRDRRYGNSAESQKLKKARDFCTNIDFGTIVERYFEDETYQMRMQAQGYSQSDMEVRKGLLQRLLQGVQPYQGSGSDTIETI